MADTNPAETQQAVPSAKQPGPIAQAKVSIEERIAALDRGPEEEPAPESAESAEQAPEKEAKSEEAPEEKAEADAETQDAEASEGDGDDGVEYIEAETLADLAEALNLDVAELYEKIKIPIPVADGRKEVTIGEWKDSWIANNEVAAESQRLKEAKTQLDQERRQMQEQVHAQITEAAGIADQLQAAMLAPFEQVPWAELREEDPARWAAQRQEMLETQQKAQGMRAAVQQQIQQYQQQMAQQQQAQKAEILKREREALIRAIPEFGNQEQAPAEMQALRTYLAASGFTDDEIETAYDHRLVVMARKARMFDESQKSADATKKRVVKIAKKMSKPGARQSRSEQRQDVRSQLRGKLKKSGHIADAAALISELERGRQ